MNPKEPSPEKNTTEFRFPSRNRIEVEEVSEARTSSANNAKPAPSQQPSVKALEEALPLDLPSGFMFYDFKELSARHIRGKHQAKFAVAAANSSTRISVDVVSSLLEPSVNAADLTIPDFFFVLYQLRINSMGSKNPMIVRTVCSDPDHLLRVFDKEVPAEKRLPESSLKDEITVNASSIDTTYVDNKKFQEFLESDKVKDFEEETGLKLDAVRMSNSIQLEDLLSQVDDKDQNSNLEVEALEWMADMAGAIRNPELQVQPGLLERISIVENLFPHQIAVLKEWVQLLQSYGVEETVITKCKECGAEIRTEVLVSASSFL